MQRQATFGRRVTETIDDLVTIGVRCSEGSALCHQWIRLARSPAERWRKTSCQRCSPSPRCARCGATIRSPCELLRDIGSQANTRCLRPASGHAAPLRVRNRKLPASTARCRSGEARDLLGRLLREAFRARSSASRAQPSGRGCRARYSRRTGADQSSVAAIPARIPVDRRVHPEELISPSIVTRSPSRLIASDVKVSSGSAWASKKSGLCRPVAAGAQYGAGPNRTEPCDPAASTGTPCP